MERPAAFHPELCDRHENGDHGQEEGAGGHGAHTKAAIGLGLRQLIADSGAQRAGQNVGDPEGQHGIRAQPPRQIGKGNQDAESQCAPGEAKTERLSREVTGRGAKRERAEDSGPVKELTPRRHDFVDGEGALDPVPDQENNAQCDGEHRGANIQTDAQAVGEEVRDLRRPPNLGLLWS